jgi:acyl carrier protein
VTNDRIRQKTIILVRDHLGLDQDLTDATTLGELKADSLDLIELGMALEDEFHVAISDDMIAQWRTVGDVLDWLGRNAKVG